MSATSIRFCNGPKKIIKRYGETCGLKSVCSIDRGMSRKFLVSLFYRMLESFALAVEGCGLMGVQLSLVLSRNSLCGG